MAVQKWRLLFLKKILCHRTPIGTLFLNQMKMTKINKKEKWGAFYLHPLKHPTGPINLQGPNPEVN